MEDNENYVVYMDDECQVVVDSPYIGITATFKDPDSAAPFIKRVRKYIDD